jgi:hypothetical protein
MKVALAATHHDPHGLLDEQAARVLPQLSALYEKVVVMLSPATRAATWELLEAAGARVTVSAACQEGSSHFLGRKRRQSVALALEDAPDASHVHLCDFDRVLHWAEFYPDELRAVLPFICAHDFTSLGRTPRAFASHPRTQRYTEGIINHVFSLASGRAWDVTAASRGLSRRAAAVIAGCADDTIGNDCSWPLCVMRHEVLSNAYLETEGLEFETPDRYPREVAAAGGLQAWLDRIDSDPAQWARRLELARIEVESVAAFGGGRLP